MKARWPEGDVAPAIALAGRAMLAATISRLTEKGFDGLTPAIVAFITKIDPDGDRATVLAERAGVTKQAMSQLMRLVTLRGYVEQVPDPTDTRAKIVRCTARGLSLRTACLEVRDELHALIVKELGERDAGRLRADLERVSAAFREETAKLPRPVRKPKKE